MPSNQRRKELLQNLVTALRNNNEPQLAARIEEVMASPDAELESFLVSNELWGGAGSIADQAGLPSGIRTDGTRSIERALIELGEEQIRLANVNGRTATWVSVFKKWLRDGI